MGMVIAQTLAEPQPLFLSRVQRVRTGEISTKEDFENLRARCERAGAKKILIGVGDWRRLHSEGLFQGRGGFEWLVELEWKNRNSYPVFPRPDRWILISDGTDSDLNEFQDLSKWPGSIFDLIIRPELKFPFSGLLKQLPPSCVRDVYFEFLPWTPQTPFRLTVGEVREFLQMAYQLRPDIRVQTYPGLEVLDDRVDQSLDVEPLIGPLFDTRNSVSSPEFSIVIPTYNNGPFLRVVLKHLFGQEFPRESFEIIVVDDGSEDGTREIVEALLDNLAGGGLQVAYMYMPRHRARRRGDDHYRAGIARNLGAYHARGRYLLFLDSDIVVGRGFLKAIAGAAKEADVIQCERHHLLPRYSNDEVIYENVDFAKQTYIEQENYRRPFYEAEDWEKLPMFWKYTCTYCLLVRRDDFVAVGRFKRNYTTYGFEDVDLGFELAKMGRRFKLLHEKVLHLTPPRHSSEYGRSHFKRHRLLSKTAKTFFRQHLDPEIYDHFKVFMKESPLWARWFARWRSFDWS